jgi:DNA helicase HerA-like ATPase
MMYQQQNEKTVPPLPRVYDRNVVGHVYTGRRSTSTEELDAYIFGRGLVSRGELVGIMDKDRNRVYIARVISMDTESPLSEVAEIVEKARELRTEFYSLVKELIKDPRSVTRHANLKLMFIVNLDKNGNLKHNEDGSLDTKGIDEPPEPGMPVIKFSVDDYKTILNLKDEKDGICIGRLVERPDVKVCIDKNFFRLHFIILGQPGVGKSEATTKIVEEYMKYRDILIVIMDPHGEYVDIDKSRLDGSKVFNVNVVRPGERDFAIGYNKLSPEEVKLIAQLVDENNPPSEQGLEALAEAHANYLMSCVNTDKKSNICTKDGKPKPYFDVLREIFNSVSGNSKYRLHEETKKSIIRRINLMEKLRIWSPDPVYDLDVRQLVQGYNAVVVDYSGAETSSVEARILASIFLNRLIDRKKRDPDLRRRPLLLVVDEATHFIPRDYDTVLSRKFRELIGEMRKFNLGVALVTQTPHKVHPDVLDPVNTKVLFRLQGSGLDEVKKFGNLSNEDLEHLKALRRDTAFIISSYITENVPIVVEFDKPNVKHYYLFQ